MEWIYDIFGHGKNLDTLQMSSRAILVFFIALILLRIAGVRTFGKKTAFDNVIIIMLGSVLSRAVVGASPFLPITVASLVFVIVHWLLARLSFKNKLIGKLVKGEKISLYENGKENLKNMAHAKISHDDLLEGVRVKTNASDLANVKEIFIERNGELSVIKIK